MVGLAVGRHSETNSDHQWWLMVAEGGWWWLILHEGAWRCLGVFGGDGCHLKVFGGRLRWRLIVFEGYGGG